MTSARLAGFGAWLGAVDARAADGTLRRVQALLASGADARDRTGLRWLDGLLGVVLGDEWRVQRVRREILGDTARALRRRGTQFLDQYGQPPPAHRGLVEDAKKRLAAIGATDASGPRAVAPR